MADNTEYLPQIGVIDDSRTLRNYKLVGDGNVVHRTSTDVIVNGKDNFVGEECQRVNILASSGCTITSGVTDVSIINSSGITVNYPGNVIYVDNFLVTSSSFITSGTTFNQSFAYTGELNYDMTTEDYTVVNVTNTEILLPPALGQTQVFRIVNACGVDNTFYTTGSDTIYGFDNNITLSDGDAITVQSDGSSKYFVL